jgi:hypothetical protein
VTVLTDLPVPAPADDPGHLFTDAEWAQVVADAELAGGEPQGHRLLLDSFDRALLDRISLAASGTLYMPAKYHGGPQTPTLQVIHSAETPLRAGYAVAIGKMFAVGPAAQTSAFKMVDPRQVVQMLPPNLVGFHVGPSGNLGSLGYEQAGYAHFTLAEWTTPDGLDQLELLAAELAADGLTYGIPDRHLTDAQLRRWHDNGRRAEDGGRATHDQVHRVLGGTTHTDPMPWYPLDRLNAAVTRHRGGQPAPTPPEDIVLDTDIDKIAAAVWARPLQGDLKAPEQAGQLLVRARLGWALVRDQLPGVSARAVKILDVLDQMAGRPAADIDEAALAAELAPLINAGTVSALSVEALQEIASAVNDELAQRLAGGPAPTA